MNNNSQAIRVGLFFLLGVALSWITFQSLSGETAFKKHGYHLIAPFANLKGLKIGDEVMMAGVKIGVVDDTRLGRNRVEAVLTISPTVQIPNDAVASVETSSLLGSQHLAVSFGNSPTVLKDGDEMKTKNTVDMNEVIAQLGALGSKLEGVADNFSKALGGGDTGNNTLLGKIDRLVTDTGPKLTETVSNLHDVTAMLKSGEGTLGKLINDPKLHDELLISVSEIRSAAADARTFMADAKGITADIRGGKGALGVLLYDPVTAANVSVTMNNFRTISDKIARGEGTLGKLLSDDAMYRDMQGVMRKADSALDGLNDSGPIQAVGVAAKSLF